MFLWMRVGLTDWLWGFCLQWGLRLSILSPFPPAPHYIIFLIHDPIYVFI